MRTEIEQVLSDHLANLFNIVTELNVESMVFSQMDYRSPTNTEAVLYGQSEEDADLRMSLVIKGIWTVLEYITKNNVDYDALSNAIPVKNDSFREEYKKISIHKAIADRLKALELSNHIDDLADNIAPEVSAKFESMTEEERKSGLKRIVEEAKRITMDTSNTVPPEGRI